mmetsp:Transcript_12146/g.35226  ORF Transcript_12146/g.35226 Transcript_12146/m.35226 type:complete len:90 (+) Transcript_12146:183-452(+)
MQSLQKTGRRAQSKQRVCAFVHDIGLHGDLQDPQATMLDAYDDNQQQQQQFWFAHYILDSAASTDGSRQMQHDLHNRSRGACKSNAILL